MKKIAALVSIIGSFLITGVVYAATSTPAPTSEPININIKPPGILNFYLVLGLLITNAITIVFVVADILVFIMLIWGGIQWIVSGGDKAGSENARKRITSALVGLAIVFAAWAIAMLINTLFGVDIFTLTIPAFYQTP